MEFALHHLEKFVVAGQEGNLARAAKQVGLSESGLNRAIDSLEAGLGVSLFEKKRNKRHYNSLTSYGRVLLAEAPSLVRRAEEIRRKLSAVANGEGGEKLLRIALATGAAVPRIARLFAECRKEDPKLILSVQEKNYADIERDLGDGVLEVGFANWLVYGNDDRPASRRLEAKGIKLKDNDVKLTAIWDDPMVAAVHPESPLASMPTIGLDDIWDAGSQPLYLRGSNPLSNQIASWLAEMMGGELVTGFELQLTQAASGYGVALVNGAFIEGLERQDLVFRPAESNVVSRTYALTRKNVDSPLLNRFLDRARKMKPLQRPSG